MKKKKLKWHQLIKTPKTFSNGKIKIKNLGEKKTKRKKGRRPKIRLKKIIKNKRQERKSCHRALSLSIRKFSSIRSAHDLKMEFFDHKRRRTCHWQSSFFYSCIKNYVITWARNRILILQSSQHMRQKKKKRSFRKLVNGNPKPRFSNRHQNCFGQNNEIFFPRHFQILQKNINLILKKWLLI